MTGRYWLVVMVMGLGLAASGYAVRAADTEEASDEQEAADVVVEKEDATGEAVTLDQLPAVVKATLLKEAEGGKIEAITKWTDADSETYETTVEINGKFFHIAINKDGALYSRELEEDRVALDKVPVAVMATLAKEAEGAKIVAVFKETSEPEEGEAVKVQYFTEVKIKGLGCQITVAEDGTLVSKEIAEEEDKDEDKEPEDAAGQG